MYSRERRRALWVATVAAATLTATAGVVVTAGTAQAAVGCRVAYSVASQWGGGFSANVNLT
ncbi:cellulose-binding protein, partial [Micromonospora sp. DH15]|nr:cellulose-binding protein [Micromonospora sp. DH15]